MILFSKLLRNLSQTTSTNDKIALLVEYFTYTEEEEDKNWALYILTGNTPKRKVSSSLLRQWTSEITNLPLWLLEECYHVVGDLADTLALLNPYSGESTSRSLSWWMNFLVALDLVNIDVRRSLVIEAWRTLGPQESWVFNKLITGGLRVGVAKSLVVRALAKLSGLPADIIAFRLGGRVLPQDYSFPEVTSLSTSISRRNAPYPFFLAHPLDVSVEELGSPEDWAAEWKWDGIRAQIVKRGELISIWSRGDELLTDSFPELVQAAGEIPRDFVLDGEIVGWGDCAPLPFSSLQKRIMRKKVTSRMLREIPAAIITYDLLELDAVDKRSLTFRERRGELESLLESAVIRGSIRTSPLIEWTDWSSLTIIRQKSRDMSAEGLMLKRQSSEYLVGRKRGDWWKWKVDPYSVDAVMVYAQKGHGKRADLFTDYTFALWDNDKLVPFAKAYSGLTDEEIRKVDRWIRSHTKEKFGPVRTVEPGLVFEIAFEGIQKSNRHKSGIAVRFPRIIRWRTDKPIAEADTLESLSALL